MGAWDQQPLDSGGCLRTAATPQPLGSAGIRLSRMRLCMSMSMSMSTSMLMLMCLSEHVRRYQSAHAHAMLRQ